MRRARPPARLIRGLLPLLALGALVASCTGTSENIPPLLLTVGRVDSSGTPQMVLVEDNFSPNLTVPRALSVVPGSARALSYPAVAADVVDRALTRTTMVVLTRQLSGAGAASGPVSYLRFFNLQGIDPTSPAAFAEDTSRAVELSGSAGDPFGTGPCFTAVTISLDGRYAALLSSPQACDPNSSNIAAIYVLDTENPASSANRCQVTPSRPIQDTPPFDDQASTGEQLHFLEGGTANAEVWTVDVPYDCKTTPEDTGTALYTNAQTALGSNGSGLVAITNTSRYTPGSAGTSYLETPGPTASADQLPHVASVHGATAMGIDPTGVTTQVVVPGYDRAAQGGTPAHGEIAVHADPNDAKFAHTPAYPLAGPEGCTGVAAAIDPINQFAYVVGNDAAGRGRVIVIDLLSLSPSETIPCDLRNVYTLDLSMPKDATGRNVTAVTWTRAAP